MLLALFTHQAVSAFVGLPYLNKSAHRMWLDFRPAPIVYQNGNIKHKIVGQKDLHQHFPLKSDSISHFISPRRKLRTMTKKSSEKTEESNAFIPLAPTQSMPIPIGVKVPIIWNGISTQPLKKHKQSTRHHPQFTFKDSMSHLISPRRKLRTMTKKSKKSEEPNFSVGLGLPIRRPLPEIKPLIKVPIQSNSLDRNICISGIPELTPIWKGFVPGFLNITTPIKYQF